MNEEAAKFLISDRATVAEALGALNRLSGESMTLFAIDGEGRMTGTVTDGDIRRALIAGVSLTSPVGEIAYRNFLAIRDPKAPFEAIEQARRRRIDLLPVLTGGRVTDVVDLRRSHTLLPLDAILMAGGKGERLRPLTLTTPKPLLKVGDRPIIDRNIARLAACGVKNISVTVNYLKEQIIEHFRRPVEGVEVKCVAEPSRLGTMGSVALCNAPENENLLVMNSDLLTDLDFEAMLRHHIDSEAALTVAAVPYTVSIPFAIMRCEGTRVTGLEEKPTYNYFANAGVYIMQSRLTERIVKGEYLDAPDFIETLITDGLRVEYFPIKGRWIDIGSPDDFRYANEAMRDAEWASLDR